MSSTHQQTVTVEGVNVTICPQLPRCSSGERASRSGRVTEAQPVYVAEESRTPATLPCRIHG